MAKREKSSKLKDAELNVRVVKLMERVEELTGKGKIADKGDIVAFVGPTKAGKSTLINCLLGTQLICKRDEFTEDTYILKASELPGPTIGDKKRGQSETVDPECYGNVPGTNFAMWDFAGFGDNKGTQQELVNAISYQTILLQQNTVRFVLVVPCDMIKSDNLVPFYKDLWELKKICPRIADSLCIVSSKGDKGTVVKLLQKAASHIFERVEESNIDMINESKRIIEKVLDNGSCIDFKAPVLDEELDVKSFTLPNSQQFMQCIRKLKGTKVEDFPLVISDQAKLEIAELYTVFYSDVKREVEYMSSSIENFIQNKIDDILLEEGVNATSQLAVFKSGKTTIQDIMENSKNFKSFSDQTVVGIAGIGTNQRFFETMNKFLFIEDLKNKYKSKDTDKSLRGEEEFFKYIQVSLKSGANKFSVVIATSEAATKEEKRKEIEWQELHKAEINDLKEELKNLGTHNNSLLVKGAQVFGRIPIVRETFEITGYLADKCVIS